MLEQNDIVLVHLGGKPHVFARIERIEPDVLRGDGWLRVRIMALFVPPQVATWIIREEHARGATFVMDGHELAIAKVVVDHVKRPTKEPDGDMNDGPCEVVSLAEWKTKK